MKILDIVIICLLAVWTVAAVIYIIRSHKRGRVSCGCCSGDCAHCAACKADRGEKR